MTETVRNKTLEPINYFRKKRRSDNINQIKVRLNSSGYNKTTDGLRNKFNLTQCASIHPRSILAPKSIEDKISMCSIT